MSKSSYQPISLERVAEVARTVLIEADMPQKREMLTRIAKKQPDLVMTVACLSQYGVDETLHGHALEIFLILYMSCIEGGDKLPVIKTGDLDRAFRRIGDLHKYLEKEPDQKMWDKVIKSHPEQALLAFATGRLNELGIRCDTEPECKTILTIQGVLEALVDVRKKIDRQQL